MADKVKVWFDPEGDFLEVQFRDAPGYMRETANDAVMERVDEQGKDLGFQHPWGSAGFERNGRWSVSRIGGLVPCSGSIYPALLRALWRS